MIVMLTSVLFFHGTEGTAIRSSMHCELGSEYIAYLRSWVEDMLAHCGESNSVCLALLILIFGGYSSDESWSLFRRWARSNLERFSLAKCHLRYRPQPRHVTDRSCHVMPNGGSLPTSVHS
ncbi:hypothetical protein BKA64DRAFT_670584 [Cadophora sp. MPI-SDFR-AT-0126]|nr:hypothetical protein BKA64DRAFT_670584 [Leotiomycetes sp. MPI-SDFR-AT-0126]